MGSDKGEYYSTTATVSFFQKVSLLSPLMCHMKFTPVLGRPAKSYGPILSKQTVLRTRRCTKRVARKRSQAGSVTRRFSILSTVDQSSSWWSGDRVRWRHLQVWEVRRWEAWICLEADAAGGKFEENIDEDVFLTNCGNLTYLDVDEPGWLYGQHLGFLLPGYIHLTSFILDNFYSILSDWMTMLRPGDCGEDPRHQGRWTWSSSTGGRGGLQPSFCQVRSCNCTEHSDNCLGILYWMVISGTHSQNSVKEVKFKWSSRQGLLQDLWIPHAREGRHLQWRDKDEAQRCWCQWSGVCLLLQASHPGSIWSLKFWLKSALSRKLRMLATPTSWFQTR